MEKKEIIKSSKTISEAIIKLFGYYNGKTKKKFLALVYVEKIDISHLTKRKFKYERITKICPVCGKEFITEKGSKREKTSCSYACSNTYFRSGKQNPNWREESYRSTCFEEHEKKCVICGEDKMVTVHHFDENRKNNSVENLIPLCPTHHYYMHSRYKYMIIDKVEEYINFFLDNIENKKTIVPEK